MNTFLESEFCGRLCLALAHSLWQVGAVAVVVSAIAYALRRQSANVRYNVYLAGLLVSLAAFPLTLAMLNAPKSAHVVDTSAAIIADVEHLQTPPVNVVQPLPAPIVEPSPALPSSSLAPRPSLRAPLLPRFVPWIAVVYLVGVCAMALRLAIGMWSAGTLSRRAAGADRDLVARLERIARQWQLRVVPRLAVSAEVVVPKVVGILRPVILLPLSAATGLAPDQLDMILAHELAHVRRHDLWVNLLQRIAETVLFFNPAIWYLSRRLTMLREYASDELVCKGTDAPTTRYAAALVRVAELSRPRAAAEIAALAATGRSPSELRRRVARLVGEPLREPVRLSRTGVISFLVLAALLATALSVWPTESVSAEQADEAVNDQALADTIAELRHHSQAVHDNLRKRTVNVSGANEPAWRLIGQLSGIENLSLTACDLRTNQFSEIVKLNDLKRLTIRNCKFLPEQLAPLAALKNLEHLDVMFSILEESDEWRNEQFEELTVEERTMFERSNRELPAKERIIQTALITDRSLPAISRLTKLKSLRLVNTFLTTDGLKQLEHLKNLEELEFGVLDLSPDAAKQFRNMPKLRSLRYFNASDGVIAELAALQNLQTLDIWCDGVTDSGAADLAKLTKLEQLEVRGNQITDRGLLKLAAIPNLKHLDLKYSKAITQAGVEQFRAKRPECSVLFEPASPVAAQTSSDIVPAKSGSAMRELRSGAKVKLLGIGTHGETPRRWWNGDGTPLDNVPFKLEGPRGQPSDKVVARELVFRVDGVLENAMVRAETKPLDGAPSQVVWESKTPIGNCHGLMFLVPKDHSTFQFRVGVAGGKWQTINKSEPSGSQATGIAGGHGIVFSQAFGRGDDTVVIVSHNMENENTRVVAVDLAGSEFVGERADYVSAVGEVNQATWKFPGLLPESIKEFRFQTRLFLWVEFDELPVEADAAKPAVESLERKSEPAKLNETESTEPSTTPDGLVEQLRSLQKQKKEFNSKIIEAQSHLAVLQAQIDIDVKRQMLKDPTKVKVDPQVRQRQQELRAQIEVQKAELSALYQVIKKLRDATDHSKAESSPDQADDKASTDAQPMRDPLEMQIDDLLRADPKVAMLQQEIMTRDYWIMQLKTSSKRDNSPQIKQYEKEKAALQKQIDEYREQVKKQLQEQLEARPFVVRGRVTDQEGKPMEGAVIRAATGIGTLIGGGSTVTDADGRYKLHFGRGMTVMEDYAPLGVGVQAAIISANKPGWYEVNLNRQGSLLMSDQKPESLKKENLWGRESIDSVVFPNQPREVNFTLVPAVVIEGELVGDGTWEIENQSLSLTGEELPPASSVFTSVTTNKDGKFQMDAVPPGKPWRFEMRIKRTGGEVLSDPFTIPQPGVYRCVVSLDTETREDGSVVLKLRQEAVKRP